MSTKIYEGFVLDMSIYEAIDFLRSCRKSLFHVSQKILTAAEIQLWVDVAVEHGIYGKSMEDAVLGVMPEKDRIAQYHLNNVVSRFVKDPTNYFTINDAARVWQLFNRTEQSCVYCNTSFDVDLSLSLFPERGKVYGIPFGSSDMIQAFLKLPEVHDYSYWNNSDRNENVSARAWTARRKKWDKLIPSGIPAIDGFSYRIEQNHAPYLSDDDVAAWLAEHRDEAILYHASHSLFLKRFNEKQTDTPVSSYFDVIDEVRLLKVDNAKEYLNALSFWKEHYPHNTDELKNLLLV